MRIETNADPQHCLKLSYLLEQDVHEGQAEPDGGVGEVEPGESRLHSGVLQAYSGLSELKITVSRVKNLFYGSQK